MILSLLYTAITLATNLPKKKIPAATLRENRCEVEQFQIEGVQPGQRRDLKMCDEAKTEAKICKYVGLSGLSPSIEDEI
jgi:hypothetical protein